MLWLLACQSTGSVIVGEKVVDTALDSSVETSVEPGTETGSMPSSEPDTAEPTPIEMPDYNFWTGSREVEFIGQCNFSISETGERLRDPNEEIVAVTLQECPNCQVYRLQTTPLEVNCGALGALPTGGTRYRVLHFTDVVNGMLDVVNGHVEMWYVFEPGFNPNWVFELAAQGTGSNGSWNYTQENNFQAFSYTTVGTFSLSE